MIGGTAVVHHLINGHRPLTPDIDFMVTDIHEVKNILERESIKYQNLTNDIGITVPKFNLDFIESKSDTDYTVDQINSIFYNIISVEKLFIDKMLIGRDKDLQDSFLLLEYGNMDRAKFDSLIEGMGLHELKNYSLLIK